MSVMQSIREKILDTNGKKVEHSNSILLTSYYNFCSEAIDKIPEKYLEHIVVLLF
jgi:hypothetical protein